MELKSVVESALEIAQVVLDECKVWLTRCMHTKTDPLNRISNVGACQCEVLKGTYDTSVLYGVSNR